MPRKIYLDESGDLGWVFDKPYRDGGSSRFLTIAYLIIPDNEHYVPQRIVRATYKKFKFSPQKEIKGSKLKETQLDYVSAETVRLLKNHSHFELGAITVKKENVQEHIRIDENKLYNYMFRRAVIDRIDKSPRVKIIRDRRSIKVERGKSFIDYLQTVLWFECDSKTILQDIPQESNANKNLIFIDWVAHIVWSNYEDKASKHFKLILPKLSNQTLYF